MSEFFRKSVISTLIMTVAVFSFAVAAAAAEETTAVEGTTTVTEEETTAVSENKGYALGDLNLDGIITSDEARKVLRYSVSLDELSPTEMAYGEMNCDGKINSADARLILRTSVKLDKEVLHDFSDIRAVIPTCENGGNISYKCSICEKEYGFSLNPKGHSYVETGRVNATCVADGKLSEKCAVCGKVNDRVYKATGHNWLAPTATAPKTCSTCKAFVAGFNEVGEKTYYFNVDGTKTPGERIQSLTYNGVTADWYLKDGELQKNVRDAITLNSVKYIVTEGKAQKVVTEADKTYFRAFGEVKKATKPDMTKEQKLKACFDYCKNAYYEYRPRTPHYKGMDWPIVYANDMFIKGGGNCLSYGAAFAYMAKAIGYENVYCCHSGGHGWAEIDGLIYDPEWSLHHKIHSFYALSYDVVYGGQNYKAAIAPGYPWMRIKI